LSIISHFYTYHDTLMSHKPARQSNFELLRIVAMFLVLVVHADFAALGQPTHLDAVNQTGVILWRYLFEGLAIVCVNVFVLLSGWFGIRPSGKGFGKFIFQVAFFSISLFVFNLAMGWSCFEWNNLFTALTFTSVPANEYIPLYWFIVSYIGLYLLAPVLNAYVEKASQKQLGWTIILFYAFQTLYGWLLGSEWTIFKDGYSTLSFIGLYLLAQYVHKYPMKCTQLAKGWDLLIYLAAALLVAGIGFAGVYWDISGLNTRILAYSNPLVILESLALLLFFSKLELQSKLVNWVGASAFAVFLLHLSPFFYFEGYKKPLRWFSAQYDALPAFGWIVLYMIGIFIVAVLIDQIRILIYKKIVK